MSDPRATAARHFARARAGTPADAAALAAWRAADPAHERAWDETEALWAALGGAAADPRIAGLRAEALAPRDRRRWWPAAAAASLAALVTGGALLRPPTPPAAPVTAAAPDPRPVELAAAGGRITRLSLPDGSQAVLAPAARLRLTGFPRRRQVELLAGAALFEVAKRPAPFVVTAAGTAVTALGTRFTLARSAGRVTMVLAEGRVRVAPVGAAPLTVTAGTAVEVAGGVARARPADAAADAEWADGRLTFAAVPLGEAVRRLNLYAPQRIVLGDPGLARLPVSGTFRIDRGGGLPATLAAAGLVRIGSATPERVVLLPPGPGMPDRDGAGLR
ncbi:MAG: FecR domain-containing protein [Sphingomonas fennica]